MRVILAGQRSFGLAVYDMLLDEGHSVLGVWSPDDGMVVRTPEDKLTRAAFAAGAWVHPIQRTPDLVRAMEVDLFVCAHSHDFIGRLSRQATRLGGVGYHPSLLPVHRGRDAVEWTIRMGDRVAGGSVYWLTDNVDGGPIAAQRHCFVRPNWGASQLWREELFPMGVALLRKVLLQLESGVIVEEEQDEACATWEPALDGAPLYRPELPQLGAVEGMRVLKQNGVSRV